MTTNIDRSIARGRKLADDLDALVEETLHEIGTRLLHEPDDTTRALAATRVLQAIGFRLDHEIGPLRQGAVQKMRFPDGDFTGVPAMGWREIGTAVGLTPTRAQQVAGLPGDRSAPRGPRSASTSGEGST